MNRLEEFLKELSELTKKYELKIGGCGCCGSPWIADLNGKGHCGDNLRYKSEEQKYFVRVEDDEDEDEDEFEDDEDEDQDEDEAEYKAFCKQFLNADEKWELVKGLKG